MSAVLFAVSVFGFTLFVWLSFGGTAPLQAQGYRFHVLLGPEAAQLTSNAEVRIVGVPIGRVRKVKPVHQHIDAEVELESQYAPIPNDVRAILRTKTLLGEAYIELSPGSPRAPKLKEGATLPLSQVRTAQSLDQVLVAFDAKTRNDFKQFLRQIGQATQGRGVDLNNAIGNASPTFDQLQRLVSTLDRQRPALARLIRDGGVTLNALGAREADLRSLITAGDQVFAATAARNQQLTDTVQLLPGFLRELRLTLADADLAAGDAAPTLRTLRPVIPDIQPALIEAARLAPELKATFRGLSPVLTAARTGLPAATRVVNAAKPLVDVLYPAGRESVPVVQQVARFPADIIAGAANSAAIFQGTLPSGKHFPRVMGPLNNQTIAGARVQYGSNRTNPYPSPRWLDDMTNGGIRAFDCSNVNNPNTIPPLLGSPPPCITQTAPTFQGSTRQFTHVEKDAP
jgi:virulence factor Mce-like protein